VAPKDLGREKQESLACLRQRDVLEHFQFGVLVAIEQHQPAIQVVDPASPVGNWLQFIIQPLDGCAAKPACLWGDLRMVQLIFLVK
jgi:hypothetical protein